MSSHELRFLAVGTALLAAVIGLWIALRPDALALPAVSPRESWSTAAREALDTLRPPEALDSALAVAEAFGTALYTNDLDSLRQLTTDRLGATLLTPTHRTDGSTGRVTVKGTITRDLQPGRVLADVIVHRSTYDGVRLETVTVAVVLHVDGRWLVDDTAF